MPLNCQVTTRNLGIMRPHPPVSQPPISIQGREEARGVLKHQPPNSPNALPTHPPIARLGQDCWTDRLSSRQERKTDKLVVDARKAIASPSVFTAKGN